MSITATFIAVLSRRERQIMDILYQLGRATAADLMKALPGEPSDSTVRTQLRVLESKGHVRHEEEGTKYVYLPGRAAPRGSQVRAQARHEHVLRRLGRKGRRGAARSRWWTADRRRAESHRVPRRQGESGGIEMSLLDRRHRSLIARPRGRPGRGLGAAEAAGRASPLDPCGGPRPCGGAAGDQPGHSRDCRCRPSIGLPRNLSRAPLVETDYFG